MRSGITLNCRKPRKRWGSWRSTSIGSSGTKNYPARAFSLTASRSPPGKPRYRLTTNVCTIMEPWTALPRLLSLYSSIFGDYTPDRSFTGRAFRNESERGRRNVHEGVLKPCGLSINFLFPGVHQFLTLPLGCSAKLATIIVCASEKSIDMSRLVPPQEAQKTKSSRGACGSVVFDQ